MYGIGFREGTGAYTDVSVSKNRREVNTSTPHTGWFLPLSFAARSRGRKRPRCRDRQALGIRYNSTNIG